MVTKTLYVIVPELSLTNGSLSALIKNQPSKRPERRFRAKSS